MRHVVELRISEVMGKKPCYTVYLVFSLVEVV